MDFETLYKQYSMECTKEWQDYSTRKAYKALLKDMKMGMRMSHYHGLEANQYQRKLNSDLSLKTTDLKPNECSYYILLSTGAKKPHGYGRLITAYEEKENDMIRFFNLFLLLKEMMLGYNKEYQLTIENLILLKALLQVANTTFFSHLEEYETMIQEIEEKLQKDEIPCLKSISKCEELQIFIQDTFIEEFHTEGLSRKKGRSKVSPEE